MTGFKVPRTVFKMEFGDSDYAGMEIRVRKASFGDRLASVFDLSPDESDTVQRSKDKLDELHELFVQHLVDWNLTEDDGTPVPATLDGLRSLEPEFLGLIVSVWKSGGAAPGPLEVTSPPLSAAEDTLADLPVEPIAS